MDVNTNIWGTPEEWQNISSSTWVTQAGCKIPKSGRTSYYNAFNSGALTAGEVPTDLSLAFWGIGKGSILAHPMYLSSYWDGDIIKTAVNEVEKPSTVPCILNWTSDPSSTQANMGWSYRYAPTDNPGESNWNVVNLAGNAAAARTLITSYNYQNIFLIPYVKVAKAETSSWSTAIISLKAYIDSMLESGTYSSYDKVISIGYQIAIGDGINNNRTTGLKEMGIVFSVSFEGSQRSYNDGSRTYTWYATRYGIDALMTNLALNSYTHSLAPYYEWSAENFSNLHLVGDADTGWRRKYCKNYYAGGNVYGQVPIYYYNPDDDIWKINDSLPWNTNYAYPFPYIECTLTNADAVKDYILKQIAFLGFPFMYDPTLAARGQIGDTGVFLPEFNDAGITTGEYAEGRAALRLTNSEWIDGRTGSGYDPYAPPSPSEEDSGYLINPFNSNRFTTGLNVWCMYQQDILDVLAGINNLYLTDPEGNEKWQLDFKGSNPDDYIVSCKAMLLDVAHTESTYAFTLGPVQFDGIGCYKYNGTGSFSFGTIPLDGTGDYIPYGDFRDYQPYTTMELYIPLCGTVEIDPEFFVGHSIEIIMMYDIYTGACTAGIYRDNFTLWKAVNGQIGADIPVSALQMGTYQNAIHSLQAAQKQNEIRLASSAITVAAGAAALIAAPATGGTSLIAGAGLISGAAGLLSGVMQEQNYDYQIEHTQPIPAQTTAAETQNNFCVGGLYPILYVKRAKMLQGYDAEIYSHTIGNACLINGQVGSQTGLVMCSSVDLSGVPATVEEINAIKQALGKGVYV